MDQKNSTKKIIFGLIAFSISISNHVFASGLTIPLESVSAMGEQRSGGAASADDAATNFFNPAGLVRVKHQQLIVSAIGADGRERFIGTVSNPGSGPGGAITETSSASTSVFSVVPSIHYVRPLSDRFAFGVSILTPYALSSDYPVDSILRYDTIESAEASVDISPSLAYQVTSQFSVGLGVDMLYLRANQKTAVRTQPLTTQDSISTEDVGNYARGWHMGVLYAFTPATRVGFAYRSAIITHLNGRSELSVPNGPSVGTYTSTKTKITIPLASLTTLSLYHDVTPKWALMGSIEYESWSIYKNDHSYNLPVIGGGTTDIVAPRNLRNTLYFAFGTRYQVNERWLLRTGISFWQGASDGHSGDITIVDPNSMGIGFGARYQYSPCVAIDVAGGHIFTETAALNYTSVNSGNTVVGHSNAGGSLLGVQVTWNIT